MVKTYRKSGIHSKLRACYKKRKDCIKKKTSELATLCGVNACVVCIGPEGDIESWPENPDKVKSVIDMYNDYLKNGKNNKINKKEAFINDLSSVVDEKLKKVEERIEFLKFVNQAQEDYHIVPYCMEETESRENMGIVSFDMDSDTYEHNMIWNKLENKEEKSTIVSEGSCGGSTSSPCYIGHPIEIDTYYGAWNNVFEWNGENFNGFPEPVW